MRRSTIAMAALMATVAGLAVASPGVIGERERMPPPKRGLGGKTRSERSPAECAERLSARQERMQRKAERRALRNNGSKA